MNLVGAEVDTTLQAAELHQIQIRGMIDGYDDGACILASLGKICTYVEVYDIHRLVYRTSHVGATYNSRNSKHSIGCLLECSPSEKSMTAEDL